MGEDGVVANADGHLSARLRRAQDRLERAVDSLDSALETSLEAAVKTSLEAAADEDGARTNAAAAGAENSEFKKISETVSARLESTIGRLRAVLED